MSRLVLQYPYTTQKSGFPDLHWPWPFWGKVGENVTSIALKVFS